MYLFWQSLRFVYYHCIVCKVPEKKKGKSPCYTFTPVHSSSSHYSPPNGSLEPPGRHIECKSQRLVYSGSGSFFHHLLISSPVSIVSVVAASEAGVTMSGRHDGSKGSWNEKTANASLRCRRKKRAGLLAMLTTNPLPRASTKSLHKVTYHDSRSRLGADNTSSHCCSYSRK
jgi:hypothetical protein